MEEMVILYLGAKFISMHMKWSGPCNFSNIIAYHSPL